MGIPYNLNSFSDISPEACVMRGTYVLSILQSAVHALDRLVHEGQYHMRACEVCRTRELLFLQSAICRLDAMQQGGDCNSS